jgi:23S rRNA pseudouridine2605 synthase
MTSKDKPKRGEAKTFIREIKPKSADAAGEKTKTGSGFKKRAPAKPRSDAPRSDRPRSDAPRSEKPRAEHAASDKPAKPMRRQAASAETAASDGKPERISKILARVGVASRRDIERMIMDGRVSLNGKVLDTPVVNVTFDDAIEVDGVPIRGVERTRLWLYHKPGGLVTTNSDPEGRPTVFESLPGELPRVLSIGRLDINTEGLLLLTNDGGLSRVLELPTTGWLRRYRVRAHGEVDQEALDKLKDGIAVDGVLYGSIEATLDRSQGRNVWITMGLREGKNREIKNVLGALGLEVNRLIRISYGPFQLGDLPEGEVMEVRGRTLRDQLGPRLIEEAKANFDAPIYNETPAASEDEKPARSSRSEWSSPADRPARPRDEDRRERSLGRLDTKATERKFSEKPAGKFGAKPEGKFGAKPGFKSSDRDLGDEKPKKRPPMGTSRTANVWMAPGARPNADGSVRAVSARAQAEQLFRKQVPENDRRVIVKRADDDADWIRADSPPEPEKGEFGAKRSFGDKPRGDKPRGDKPRSDRPRSDSSRGDSPRGERSFGDRKPRESGDRPYGDKPRGERSFGDRPSRGERPTGDRPTGDRRPRQDGDRPARAFNAGEGRSDRPRSDRPYGDRPARGDRPTGDRPTRDRPTRDRPTGDRRPREDGDRPARAFNAGESRPDRPRSDRPFGDKPAFGDKPRSARPAGKSFGGKPSGGKPSFGGKPSGGKPSGGRPSGGKPGGRPAGARSGGPGGKPRTPRG